MSDYYEDEWYEDEPDDEVYGEETDDFAHVDDYSEAEQDCMLCSGPCGQCDEVGDMGLTLEQRVDFYHALTRYSELDLREDPPDTNATGENSSPVSD